MKMELAAREICILSYLAKCPEGIADKAALQRALSLSPAQLKSALCRLARRSPAELIELDSKRVYLANPWRVPKLLDLSASI